MRLNQRRVYYVKQFYAIKQLILLSGCNYTALLTILVDVMLNKLLVVSLIYWLTAF